MFETGGGRLAVGNPELCVKVGGFHDSQPSDVET